MSPAPQISPQPKLIAIAAMASNRIIGKDGKLPWHLPEDLKFFKRTTLGQPVLMGRKTFDSIVEAIGRPLPGRQNIVLSHNMSSSVPGVVVIRQFEDLRQIQDLPSPIYLIGGAQLYESLLSKCDELLLTRLDAAYEGDTSFPEFEPHFDPTPELVLEGDGFKIWRYSRLSAA